MVLLADSMNALGWVFLAIAIVGAMVFFRFATNRSDQQSNGDTDAEETSRSAAMAAKRVTSLEVRLHDFSREVEARLETRAAQLDGLVTAADREIARLTDLLKSTPGGKPAQVGVGQTGATRTAGSFGGVTSELTGAQEQMVLHLHGAGFGIPEIAHIVGGSPEAIRSILRAA